MSSPRDTLHDLIDRLPEQELGAALRFIEFLTREEVTPAFAESIRAGIQQADAGLTVDCRNYDEMVGKLLGEN